MKSLIGKFLFALLFLALTQIPSAQAETAKAIFAGGCYWSMEAVFDPIEGVVSATSGFAGGEAQLPSYQQAVASGAGHVEAVEVVYDPHKISYDKLLDAFWKNIDPTDASGQFCDRGPRYRTAIFYYDNQQKSEAEKSESEVESHLQRKIATQILPAMSFYPAEASEQNFTETHKQQYMKYKMGCGRDRRLREVWGSDKDKKETESGGQQ
jgi:peptide-methionine (S)-S-oxide reductase